MEVLTDDMAKLMPSKEFKDIMAEKISGASVPPNVSKELIQECMEFLKRPSCTMLNVLVIAYTLNGGVSIHVSNESNDLFEDQFGDDDELDKPYDDKQDKPDDDNEFMAMLARTESKPVAADLDSDDLAQKLDEYLNLEK